MAQEGRSADFEAGTEGRMAGGSTGSADGIGRGYSAFLAPGCEVKLTTGITGYESATTEPGSEQCQGSSALYSWHYVNADVARRHGWSSFVGSRWGSGWLCEFHLAGLVAMQEVTNVWADGIGTDARLVK